MAPLDPNLTAVYFVDYTFNGEGHTFQLRGHIDTPATLLAPIAQAILDEVDVLACTGWQVTGTRYRPAGSSVTLPSIPVTMGSAGGGVLNPVNNPRFASWIGRGQVSGRRTRLYLFGLAFSMPEDYRFSATEQAVLATVQNILQDASDEDILATVANDAVTWYEYQNAGFNSYWERQQRG